MSEAMEAEFDTVAEWTAQVAQELGPEYYVPAACRGSGSPAALDWLIDRMGLAPGQLLLDSGAGVGGPAAYAARSRSVQPVLVEPEAGACRAAKRLFDFPAVRGLGTALPMADSSFDAAWSLGVLCTMPDQLTLLGSCGARCGPGDASACSRSWLTAPYRAISFRRTTFRQPAGSSSWSGRPPSKWSSGTGPPIYPRSPRHGISARKQSPTRSPIGMVTRGPGNWPSVRAPG